MSESSTKPYLIRALHEWCTDNGYTPHIVVTVDHNTVVPPAHIHDGQITLNVGWLATNGLVMGNDYIEFQARFSGVTEHIFVPVAAVSAIYARETGAGMGFEVEPSLPNPGGDYVAQAEDAAASSVKPAGASDDNETPPNGGSKRPQLKVIK